MGVIWTAIMAGFTLALFVFSRRRGATSATLST
jgi:hypothetical protein